jgi:hypothetical protein
VRVLVGSASRRRDMGHGLLAQDSMLSVFFGGFSFSFTSSAGFFGFSFFQTILNLNKFKIRIIFDFE